MKSYESPAPHAAAGLIAVVLTAITMGALVVLPAKLDALHAAPLTLAGTDRNTLQCAAPKIAARATQGATQ
jgi:hypothetical protein